MATFPLADSPYVDIDALFESQRRNADRVGSSTAAERRRKLKRIERALLARRREIRAAMFEDFRKPAEEVDLSEIYPAVGEARHAARHVHEWMRPQPVGTPLSLLGSTSRIVHQPKGVVLIISPWNFPFNLSFGPLVSAVAAGNCIVLKPSEMTPHSSACMKRILADLFDENEVAVVEGDARVAEALLKKKFDHVFFTGSPAVGKIVMKAAAEHLTSVTLELGGKSPVIVDKTADIDEAAKKVAWGKFVNSGQTCIAPDYLLVDESIAEEFTRKLVERMRAMDSDGSAGWIVNERHAMRIKRMYDAAIAAGAKAGDNAFSDEPRRIKPALLTNVKSDTPLMQEEIFGPVLPMITYRSIDDAIAFVNERERPLVSYVFSRDRRITDEFLARTRSGAMVINHTLIHFFQLNLPFGGTGTSGVGKAHGYFGFEAFSNARGVFDQRTKFSTIELMFPPYTRLKRKIIDLTLKYF